MPTLHLLPDSNGYALRPGKQVIVNQLDGGAPRIRLDQLGAVGICTVKWTLGAADYAYIMAFFRTGVIYGSLPFQIELIFDDNDPELYTVQFVEDTFQLASQQGLEYVVGASLYVTPNAINIASDDSLIALYDATANANNGGSPSDSTSALIKQLQILTNTQIGVSA